MAGRNSSGTLPVEAFRSGQLPAICAVTGEPSDDWYEMNVKSAIGAQWFLLLLGIVPFVIVRAVTVKRTHGYLPISRAAVEQLKVTEREENAQLRRRLRMPLVISLIAVPALVAVVTLIGSYSAASEVSSGYRDNYERAKEDWPKIMAELPASQVRPTEWSDDIRETFRAGSHGCIDFQQDGATSQVCEPEEPNGVGVTLGWNMESLVDDSEFDGTILYLEPPTAQSEDFGLIGTYPASAGAVKINLGRPIIRAFLAAVLVLVVFAVGYARARQRGARIPSVRLDKAGQRVQVTPLSDELARATSMAGGPRSDPGTGVTVSGSM